MKKLVSLAMVLGLVLGLGTAAMAAESTDITVSATVQPTCRFATPLPTLAFGTLDQSSLLDATVAGNLRFWCTIGTAYILSDEFNIGVADGAFSGTLVDGANNIPYSISYNNFQGPGLGRSAEITSLLTATILNANYINAPPGAYSDIVTFTINP